MQSNITLKDLVLVGGGHAHVHVIKMFGMNPIKGVRITLITRDILTPYSGMIPGYVAGYYTKEECHVDLGMLCSFAGVRLIHAEACGLNIEKKHVKLSNNRPPISYDVVSIDIGISPKPLGNNLKYGFKNITPVKPIDSFANRWQTIVNRLVNFPITTPLRVAIVGGGGGGCELAFAIHFRLQTLLHSLKKDPNIVTVKIVTRTSELMDSHSRQVQDLIRGKMTEKGIEVLLNCEVIDVGEVIEDNVASNCLISASGSRILYDEVIWCTQAEGQWWVKDSGLETTSEGFICVQETLESVNCADVFACGDIAHLVANPRPKAGVFAVRAGPPLVKNLRHRLLGQALEVWIPQKEFLGIIGTGNGHAVASKGPLALEGDYLWVLKDRIDREWMKGYQHFPDMATMTKAKLPATGEEEEEVDGIPAVARLLGQDAISLLSKAKMRCGGCGSKVGASVLQRALNRVKKYTHTRAEVVAGAGDDAAIVLPPPPPCLLVQTIDYFRNFVSDPYLFGQIAAQHSLSDVYAMNGEAVTALALCVLPYGTESKVEGDLVQMLAGALQVLTAEKCSLVGGHTSEGVEAAMGLSVTGVVHPDKVLHKGPPRAGDVIILTKALGTGTIMAADMRAKAKGQWVSEALQSMTQSNRRAAEILSRHSCSACTDVTGFGFLGHLLEMMQYSPSSASSAAIGGTREVSLNDENDDDNDDDQEQCCVLPAKGHAVVARICLSDVPLLAGAADCVAAGVLSSLHPQNIRCARAVGNVQAGANDLVYPLLFDPQTSGGLIATVPADQSVAVITALISAGYHCASVVGEVIESDVDTVESLVWLR